MRKVLARCDQAFLSRQVSYSLSTSEGLGEVWVDEEGISSAMDTLLMHLVSRSPRKSVISVQLCPFAMHSGSGVQIAFEAIDRLIRDVDHKAFMASIFDGGADQETGVSLAALRERVMAQHGRLWAELPGGNRTLFKIVLPSTRDVARQALLGQRTFRCDIAITNYPLVRKRFGLMKGRHLVEQVERYVKSLVRFPIDMVTADLDAGSITAIYEAQPGAAESVYSRISKRLGQETFHIGKRPVELLFRYELKGGAGHSAPSAGRNRGKG